MDIFEHLSTQGIVPDAEQKAAVCHERGPLLVIAVPGSGKTTVLVSRVARLMALGLAGRENILTVTFNKAAAVDMQRRFDTLFGGVFDRGPRFSTLHSLCWQLLHNAGEPLPIMEEGARMRLIREILRTLSGEHAKVIPEEDILNASNALSYIKNRMIDAADYEGHGLSVSFPRFAEAYREAMEADGHIDFDDLLLKAYALLDKPEVLEPWQRQFTHILVDEAQDLSLVQHRILQKLAAKATSLFMVGDEDQSIYSFRGAHPESLLDFTKVWPGGQVLRMQTNYRSLPEIVRKADSFIRINKARYPKDMTAHRQGDAMVESHVFPNKQAQYDFVMSRIAELPPGETSAVLYRTHLSVVPLADRFLREGRPFTSRESGKYFFTHPITQDVRAFLELSLDPTRRDLFEAVYYKFNAFLSRAACAEVMHAPAELNVWQAAEKLARGGDFRASRLRSKLRALAGLARQTPSEALRTLYTDCEYEEYLTRSKALSVSSGAALAQWDALTAMAEGYTTVSGFLDRLDFLEASMPEWEKLSQPGAPVLSTVHGAKGLEFDQVFVLDMAENQFPSANSDMAEEARLFYVAVTRARRILHVGYALPSSPSPFFTRMFPAKAAAPAPIRRPRSPLSKVPKKPKAADLSLFPVGQGVRHTKFGVGVIEAVDASSGRATVRFAAGIRTLSLADCMEKGVLVPCEFFD